MTTYTLLSDALEPADKGAHQIVRIEHQLLAKPLFVAAHFSPTRMNWTDAKKWAEAHMIGNHSCRLPTVEEAFFIPDRSKYPAFDREVFIGADENWPWIWTSTPDAEDPESPSGDAWLVYLGLGDSARSYQYFEGQVLAVRAGQF